MGYVWLKRRVRGRKCRLNESLELVWEGETGKKIKGTKVEWTKMSREVTVHESISIMGKIKINILKSTFPFSLGLATSFFKI